MRGTADVAVAVTMCCRDQHGHRYELDTVLGYVRSDPYAVTLTFGDLEPLVTWTFGRDLLIGGITRPTGEGDVRVHPSPGQEAADADMLLIELCSPDGHLLLEVRADEVTSFVARTVDVCAPGVETDLLDVDQIIAQLLTS